MQPQGVLLKNAYSARLPESGPFTLVALSENRQMRDRA
jgi:hypothetical protein